MLFLIGRKNTIYLPSTQSVMPNFSSIHCCKCHEISSSLEPIAFEQAKRPICYIDVSKASYISL